MRANHALPARALWRTQICVGQIAGFWQVGNQAVAHQRQFVPPRAQELHFVEVLDNVFAHKGLVVLLVCAHVGHRALPDALVVILAAVQAEGHRPKLR